MNDREAGLPIEQFIQALTSQLDRAQATMALKARAGLPLTFAVKDVSIDLRTHVEMTGSVVRIRPAGPGEAEASILHLALTTITRPMIEENTIQYQADQDERSVKQAVGDELSDDEQRRLEWVGIHNVSQLRQMEPQAVENVIARTADIPVNRLRLALEKAAQPFVSQIQPVTPTEGQDPDTFILRIRGHNLMQDQHPEVRINDEPVPVLQATRRELLIAAQPHQVGGKMFVETSPGIVSQRDFNLKATHPALFKTAAANNGGSA